MDKALKKASLDTLSPDMQIICHQHQEDHAHGGQGRARLHPRRHGQIIQGQHPDRHVHRPRCLAP
eukprot:14622119-Alexandrium_andersonii.AAC.1